MGDPLDRGHGLIPRTSKYFNNQSLSDVIIEVKDGVASSKFFAHKLLLSMAATKFYSIFYLQSDPPRCIKILNFSTKIVNLALRYIYCDELNVTNINEAVDVWRFAKEYCITDLIKESLNYVTCGKLTADRVFFLYESALIDNSSDLLAICQNFVCNDAQAALASEKFEQLPLPVVKDILRQNSLSVKSEIDVIKAVLRWCKYDCKKKNRPYEGFCMRESINPLLPFLRFLTLTPEEFCDFVEENNIFTSLESSLLTRKILQPSNTISLPSGFCSITRSRVLGSNRNHNFRSNAAENIPDSKHTEQNKVSEGLFAETKNATPMHFRSPTMVPKTPSSMFSINNYGNMPSITDITKKQTTQNMAVAKTQSRLLESFTQQVQISENQESHFENYDAFQNQFNRANKFPVLKVMPQPKNISSQRTFEFPLEDMQKGIGAMCERDVKCSAGIRIIKGMLSIHGLELKVMSLPHCPDEVIKVYVNISGRDLVRNEKLINHTLSIMFSEPLKLNQSSSAYIEITIEDLKLNRCNICRVDSVELNSSASTVAEISLKSNQTNENEGIFFLIHRLIYSPS